MPFRLEMVYTHMKYMFRPAEASELKEITELYLGSIKHLTEQGINQWDEIYPNETVLAGDIMNREMYVLTEESRILSCVVLNEAQDIKYQTGDWKHREGRIIVIHRLCVNHNFQGRGLGRTTMEYAERLIKATGYASIRLDVFSDNYISRNLYEKLGYTYTGMVTFRKGLFYLMEKSCEAIKDSDERMEA